jgi:lysozyme
MNKIAIDLAKRFEGYSEKVYLCPAGIPTSGFGHAFQGSEKPIPLNAEQAEIYLIKDLIVAENALYRLSPIVIKETEQRKAALIDFIFNLGAGRYQGSTLRRKVNELDWEAAKTQIVKWVFATNPKTGKACKLKGLELRRNAEALLL